MIRAGDLDRYIVIEQKTAVQDAAGHEDYTWETFHEAWAQWRPLGFTEELNPEGRRAKDRASFVIRYRAGITETMRIRYLSEYWEITGVEEYGRRLEGLKLTAEKIG